MKIKRISYKSKYHHLTSILTIVIIILHFNSNVRQNKSKHNNIIYYHQGRTGNKNLPKMLNINYNNIVRIIISLFLIKHTLFGIFSLFLFIIKLLKIIQAGQNCILLYIYVQNTDNSLILSNTRTNLLSRKNMNTTF